VHRRADLLRDHPHLQFQVGLQLLDHQTVLRGALQDLLRSDRAARDESTVTFSTLRAVGHIQFVEHFLDVRIGHAAGDDGDLALSPSMRSTPSLPA
jgi:hypothetical protein